MEAFLNFIAIAVSDVTVFIVLQFIIFVLFVYSIAMRKGESQTQKYSLRMSDLVLAYSLISASLIQAISSTPVLTQFKLSIILTNLVATFYLCFFSPWFQGVIAHAVSKVGRQVKKS